MWNNSASYSMPSSRSDQEAYFTARLANSTATGLFDATVGEFVYTGVELRRVVHLIDDSDACRLLARRTDR